MNKSALLWGIFVLTSVLVVVGSYNPQQPIEEIPDGYIKIDLSKIPYNVTIDNATLQLVYCNENETVWCNNWILMSEKLKAMVQEANDMKRPYLYITYERGAKK